MTRQEFDALVEEIETRYGSRPWALRFKILFLLALGYGVFLGAFGIGLMVAVLFVAGAVAVDSAPGLILLVLGLLILAVGVIEVLQLLWVASELPKDRELTREEAPKLFDLLDRLCAATKASRVDRVLVNEDFNAGVVQIPRFGIFGWPLNMLTLGLPLLLTLSAQDFTSVLAHEIAHLAAGDGWFSGRLYRLRRSWERVFVKLHNPPESRTAWFFRRGILRFVDWYWPRFNAHALVHSRTNEYAADRNAANWIGVEHTASALWRIECQQRRIAEEIWPEIWKLANTNPEPPADLIQRLQKALAVPPDPEKGTRWIEQSIEALTNNVETHPCLSDRLRALGCSIEQWRSRPFPDIPNPSSSEALFESSLSGICRDVNHAWQREVERAWRGRYGEVASLKRQLSTIDTPDAGRKEGVEILWEKARTVFSAEGGDAAVPYLRELLALQPQHSPARLALGRHLLERGSPEGASYLLGILEKEEDELIPQACAVLAGFYRESGDSVRLREIIQTSSRFEKSAAAAREERIKVSASDNFLPHELSEQELSPLLDLLNKQSDLAEAHLVRKELRYFSGQKLFVLCVATRKGLFGRSNPARDSDLVRRLIPEVQLPGRVVIISSQGGHRSLAKKLQRRNDFALDLKRRDAGV